MALHNCPRCARPVRLNAASCPFCQADMPASGVTAQRVVRAAIGGMAIAASTACNVEVLPKGGAAPAYGGPPPKVKASSLPASPSAAPSALPLYGVAIPPSPTTRVSATPNPDATPSATPTPATTTSPTPTPSATPPLVFPAYGIAIPPSADPTPSPTPTGTAPPAAPLYGAAVPPSG